MSVALDVVGRTVPPVRGPSALDVQEVSAFYGTSQALFDVSLLVPATGGWRCWAATEPARRR